MSRSMSRTVGVRPSGQVNDAGPSSPRSLMTSATSTRDPIGRVPPHRVDSQIDPNRTAVTPSGPDPAATHIGGYLESFVYRAW